MTAPRTEAGRQAFYTDWDHVDHFRVGRAVRTAILAIEAEAMPTVDQLARAILVAALEYDRRPTNDGFEWYGSADEMAEGILSALREPIL